MNPAALPGRIARLMDDKDRKAMGVRARIGQRRGVISVTPVAAGPDAFCRACLAAGLPEPCREYRFHPMRRWRLDYAWPDHRLALEVEGGAWTGGRHTRGAGFLRDMEKYNALAVAGWRLVRCVPRDVRTMKSVAIVAEAMKGGA